jgi:hypothetical protein
MALAQYLSTLNAHQTQAEAMPTWPLYVRAHADRCVMVTLEPSVVNTRLMASIVSKPTLHVHVKEDCTACVQELKKIVEAYLNKTTPPPGTRQVYVPSDWGVLQL